MAKNILISHLPIPANKIGSWDNMVTKLIEQNPGIFDYIITPKPFRDFDGCKHFYVAKPKFERYRLDKLIKHYRFRGYYKPLKKLLDGGEDFVLNIIDNVKILTSINYFLKRDALRDRVRIIFHFRGFALNVYKDDYFDMIDTLILITKLSYKWQINKTHAMTCKVRQIYNGIDSNKFHQVSSEAKSQLKNALLQGEDKTYFLWLSQDRPKKGLHIILAAWEKIITRHPDVELIIIGVPQRENSKQVTYLGRFPNDQLPGYYQASDFYLFPTLCHEGFGLSLGEALKCGSVCIASNIDPVAEVLANGSYGRLVDFPNDPGSWVSAIESELEKYKKAGQVNIYQRNIPERVYDIGVWMEEVKLVMDEAKAEFDK